MPAAQRVRGQCRNRGDRDARDCAARLPLTVTQTVKSAAAADAKNTQSCGFIESAPETNRQSLELAN